MQLPSPAWASWLDTARVRRARLYAGLVLFGFVSTHLMNHALGLVSLQAMEAGRLCCLLQSGAIRLARHCCLAPCWFICCWPSGPFTCVAICACPCGRLSSWGWGCWFRRSWYELASPLQLGIGIHCGPTVVGHMGRGVATYLTAVGDTVNTTSRLQDQTEQFQCQLIVSAPMAHHAGLDVSGYRHAQVSVRNRTEAIDIVIIPTVDDL